MIAQGKRNILGVLVDAIDYEAAVSQVINAAKCRMGFAVCTAAVHGVVEGALSEEQKFRLNHVDLVTPDGQPVRWALRLLHGIRLPDRVYGPKLMLQICERAQEEGLPVYLYGNTSDVLSALRNNLNRRLPSLQIAGMAPSKFRCLSYEERDNVIQDIDDSKASIVFVGLGCPRQDVWCYEYRQLLSLPVVAVGGAFGVIAGIVPQAPEWMQDCGLEWLFRLLCEPKRLWRRYLALNPVYAVMLLLQALGLIQFAIAGRKPAGDLLYG